MFNSRRKRLLYISVKLILNALMMLALGTMFNDILEILKLHFGRCMYQSMNLEGRLNSCRLHYRQY